MNKDREFYFVVEVEGEEAKSDNLTIAKELKKCDILEIADIHFNHNSAVLLPLRQALNAIACCYMFVMENPSKLMLIAGHCDKSGDPPYNEWLAKKRAENVLNIVLGKREEWVKSVTTPTGPIQKRPDGKSKHEDYQMILKWIAKKYGWPCDPCDVEDRVHPCDREETKKAVTAFQENWNDDSKLRSYVNANPIKVDGLMGPETWGAFFDIYMIELADLLELHSETSRLDKYRKACKFVDDAKKTLSCGESHAHDPFDISLEDRKVYIMFLDPNEKPKLDAYPDCHKGVGDKILGDIKDPLSPGAKRSEECELFRTKSPYRMDRVTCPRPRSPFLILFPALGLPAIAEDGAIDVLALVDMESQTLERIKHLFPESDSEVFQDEMNLEELEELLKEDITRSIRYVPWSSKDTLNGKKRTQLDFASAKPLQPDWIEDLQWLSPKNEQYDAAQKGDDVLTSKRIDVVNEAGEFACSHRLTLKISAKTLEQYRAKFETKKVFRFHLKLPDSDGLYNLVNRFDESLFVRKLLKQLKSPGHHATEKAETTIKNQSEIIIYHPFLITSKDLLSIAHITDTHVCTLWDKLEQIIKDPSTKPPIMTDGNFNNYNTRFEDVLKDLGPSRKHSGQADISIITGDLVDYNRGYTENCRCGFPSDHLLNDYLFNRNWLLFYELLVENYSIPVFTIVGNHEYLINPYPLFIYAHLTAYPGEIFRWNLEITRIMGKILNMRLNQSPFAVDQNLTMDETEKLAKKINSTDNIKLWFWDAKTLLSKRSDRDEEALGELVEASPDGRLKLHDVDRGTWVCHEDCALWYFLIINPFKDYAFSHKDMAFLMVDWNVFQDKRDVMLLPRPTNCLRGIRMNMVDELKKKDAKYRIFCTHSPILDPWPELGDFYMVKAKMKKNNDDISDYPFLDPTSEKLWWGALEERSRTELIDKILDTGRPIQLSLCGHSHKNKVFQVDASDNRRRAFLHRDEEGTWDSKSPLIIVTTSAGPFGRTCEVSEWEYADLIKAGYRILTFGDDGKISTQIAYIGVEIRTTVKEDPDLMTDDFGGDLPVVAQRVHLIDKFDVFPPPASSKKKFDPNHSSLIEQISGTATVPSLDDGRTFVVKKIPSGATLRITGNDGTIVVQKNEGTVIITDNDDIITIEENLGIVTINQNDDTIIIHENGSQNNLGKLPGLVDINSNGHHSAGTDIVRVYDNYGVLQINQNPHGNDDLVDLRRNYGTFQIGYNNDTVEVGLNKGNVQIVNNTNGVFKDSEIFIYRNENAVDIYGNQGNIYVFDNAKNGKIDVKDNADTIKVNSARKAGLVTGSESKSVKYESESDLSDKFRSRDHGEQPPIDDAKPGA